MSRLRLVPLLFLLTIVPATCHAGEISIAAVGDIMLGGRGAGILDRRGYDHPFAATSTILRNADISVGNLEAPITRGGNEFVDKRFRFRADPRTAAALKRAGFTLVTLANNHALDFGPKGLEDTILHLSRSGISHTGAGLSLDEARRPAIVTVKGKRIGFLAYSLTLPVEFFATATRPGTAPGYLRHVTDDIARLRPLVDHVVVSFHWGGELSSIPKPYQVKVAHAAVDAGADMVLGHHPHVLQGIEKYRSGIILYSLGNFAFATQSTKSDRSVIALLTLDQGIKRLELVPLNVLNRDVRLQPAVLEGTRGRKVIDHLNAISAGMGTVISIDGTRYLVETGLVGRVATR